MVRHTRGVQGWPQHQDNIWAGFWEPCPTLKGSFPDDFESSHRHPCCLSLAEHKSQHSLPNFPLTLELSTLSFTGPALALGLSPQGRLVPPVPTPCSRKSNTIPAGLLGSKDKGCFKSLFCSFFIGCSTWLSFALC